MKDIRISIRLTSEEHEKFRIIAIKKHTTCQQLLQSYVQELISKEEKNND